MLFHGLANFNFFLVQQAPTCEFLFPKEEQAHDPALLVNADDGDLIGEMLGDEFGVDGPVGFVDDADLSERAQNGA